MRRCPGPRHAAHRYGHRVRLRRRLFWWFGITILLTGFAVGVAMSAFGPGVGSAPGHGSRLLFALIAAVAALWAGSALIARRLTRPLDELSRVTREIGAGHLGARARLGWHPTGEIAALADSINEMASRLETSLREERELLAAVSHELRSPLSRLRVLVELAKGKDGAERRLDEIEQELIALDVLIGKLLASSRLEFGALEPVPLSAIAICQRALEMAGLTESLLDAPQDATVRADPTLIGRALGNLLENAAGHGNGVEKLLVCLHAGENENEKVRLEVLDRGPGFPPTDLSRAFQAFYRGGAGNQSSLGLGLALASRIARAHGGRAFAENRAIGGARVVLELPLAENGESPLSQA